MALYSVTDKMTMLEASRRDGFSADTRMIIETLASTNQMLYDAPAFEANAGTINRTLQRAALPAISHRKVNQGVGNSASETKDIVDYICQMAAYSQIDKTIVDNQIDKTGFIQGELDAFVAAMGTEQATDIIYGDHSADSAWIDGFAKRRSVKANSGDELCIDMGGTGSKLTSVYIVKWGKTTAHLIYPRGSSSCGITRSEDGVVDATDENGKKFKAVQNYFQCDYGVTVRNPKALIRLCNIDAATINGEDLIKKLIEVSYALPDGAGNISILCNRDLMAKVDLATLGKTNLALPIEDAWGNRITTLRDMRFRQCDALLNAESAL